MNFRIITLSICAILLGSNTLKSQEVEQNIRMVKAFKADGISNEWEEPLNEYNDVTKLAFALANNDKNLYLIIESLDPQTTFSILRGGITLNINTQGKKKDGIKLTFPLIERVPVTTGGEVGHDKDDFVHDPSLMNKSIKVFGFKNIPDGDLTAENSSGIETGMSIHPNRDLIYEISIPLAQLQVDLELKKPLVYNIKINEPNKTGFKRANTSNGESGRTRGGGSGRGGMGGGHMGSGGSRGSGGGQHPAGGISENAGTERSDFWIKYKLVKA